MTPERWQQIKQVLEASLALKGPERDEYLARMCAGDAGLLAEVRSLIDSYEQSDALDTPAIESHADLLAGQLDDHAIGRRIGPYKLVEEIGRGGMGTVYRAVRVGDFEQQVAIKLVKRGFDTDFIVRKFRNERQIMAGLDHPNIARLLDGGSTEDGLPYFVMEYIAGRPIDEYCDAARLGTYERLRLFRTVCAAVHYAHRKRVVHRDIKPGNILITADGNPKLLDFGIAKILAPGAALATEAPTVTMMRLMTPEYASPEQIRGEMVTAASDVYSLGVVLYELLTGHRPYRFRSRAPHELARAICEIAPERPSTAVLRTERITHMNAPGPEEISPVTVSRARATDPYRLRRSLAGDLDNIVLMAMRKEPERRYASAEQLSEDIRRHMEGRPVAARGDTLVYRALKFFERRRAPVITAALVSTLFAAGLLWTRQSARQPGLGQPRIAPFTSFPGDENQPAFSPDGSKVAFVWGGENNDNKDVYVMDAKGGGLLRLTTNAAEDTSPAWSPDGNSILFLRSSKTETAIFVSPAANGVHRKIADVYPARLDAAGIESNVHPVAWSPDGRYLALGDRGSANEPFSVYLIALEDGSRRKLTLPPERIVGDTNPAFSPDGAEVSFIRAPGSGVSDIWVTGARGGAPRRLTFDNRDILSQTWTRDGRYIVFSSNRGGAYNLWRVPAAGGAPERIPGIGPGASDPSFSRDGRRMAYSQFFLDTNVWRIDLRNPGAPQKLIVSTMFDSSPQYSPDGSRIAFRSNRSGSHEVWTCDAEGGHIAQITNFGGPLTGTPRWSPDGRSIAFDTRPEGQADIWIVSAGGGTPRRLTTEPSEDVVPSWSQDGKWIYFASNRSGAWQVWKKAVDGGESVQVTAQGGFAAFESPDGKHVYYAKGRSIPGLWRKVISSGVEEPVLEGLKAGFWGYWAVARNGIYFFDDPGPSGRGVYFYALPSRRVRLVAQVQNRPIIGDSAFAVSPDGAQILYSQIDQSGSDIMIADYAE